MEFSLLKVLIGFSDEALSAIDKWRRQQDDLPNRSEAVRRLVGLALKASPPQLPANDSAEPTSLWPMPSETPAVPARGRSKPASMPAKPRSRPVKRRPR